MDQFLRTLGLAFLVLLAGFALLGIGWLLTGTVRIIRGACGMDPNKIRSDRCGTKDINCELCKPSENEKKKDEIDDANEDE